MVYGAPCYHSTWRGTTLWFYLYRDVFYLYLFLGLQDLLCLWIHASRLLYLSRRYYLCYYRLHVFPSERRRLSMVCIKVDFSLKNLPDSIFGGSAILAIVCLTL